MAMAVVICVLAGIVVENGDMNRVEHRQLKRDKAVAPVCIDERVGICAPLGDRITIEEIFHTLTDSIGDKRVMDRKRTLLGLDDETRQQIFERLRDKYLEQEG